MVRYDAATMIQFKDVPNDTNPDAERTYLNLLQAAPPWRKAAMVDSLTRSCQELAMAGIRMRYPKASEREVWMRLAALWLDRDTMLRVFQWDPDREGY